MILRRIENKPGVEGHRPMMTASNIHYEIAKKVRAISPGGVGSIHLMAQKLGLVHDVRVMRSKGLTAATIDFNSRFSALLVGLVADW